MTVLMDINELRRKSKVRFVVNLTLISLLIISMITSNIVSLVLSSLNYQFNLIFNIVFDGIVILFAIFYFLNIYPIVKHYYATFKTANNVSIDKHRRLKFVENKKDKTIDNVVLKVMTFSYIEGENEYFEDLYILDSDCSFEKDELYKVNTFKNIIVSFEAINDAEI